MSRWEIKQGDVLDVLKGMAQESVHCVVTSPPYWGLRDYGVAGQIGLEKTPEEYIARMVEVFRDVKRVLRRDGTLWLNIGDSYMGGGGGNYGSGLSVAGERKEAEVHLTNVRNRRAFIEATGLKAKDLVGIPWMLAFALRADGWYLRSDIIWAKPNPMPESVTDRPTKSHEYIFLLSKSADYYFDQEAVKEPNAQGAIDRFGSNPKISVDNRKAEGMEGTVRAGAAKKMPDWLPNGRNIRSVWHIATQPYKEAHFATYPEKLVEPCIRAGSSEKGCCGKCGSPLNRIIERIGGPPQGDHRKREDFNKEHKQAHSEGTVDGASLSEIYKKYGYPENRTVGWNPSCSCQAETIPCTVLDPFNGSGTTGVVAVNNGRNYIGIELNEKYVEMARRRIGGECPMFDQEVK